MKRELSIRMLCLLLLLSVVFSCAGCGEKKEQRDSREIIEELVVDYGSYGQEAEKHIKSLLKELRSVDADAADRWENIMAVWKSANTDLSIHEGVLPDGLPDTDELCSARLSASARRDDARRADRASQGRQKERGEIPQRSDRLHGRRDGGRG